LRLAITQRLSDQRHSARHQRHSAHCSDLDTAVSAVSTWKHVAHALQSAQYRSPSRSNQGLLVSSSIWNERPQWRAGEAVGRVLGVARHRGVTWRAGEVAQKVAPPN